MRKGIWALSLVFIFSLFIPPALEAKVDTEARQIRELEKRIGALEEEKEKRIRALEEEKWGFRPDRADWLEFGGEIRLDLIVPEEADSYIYLDRVEIDLKATVTEGVYSKGTIEFAHEEGEKEAEVAITEWYTRFSLEDHWLKAGLTDRFIAPGDMDEGSRKTAGYPLSGTAFWRDEQYNLTLGGMFPEVIGGDLRYRVSYGAGLQLDDRYPGDHKFDYILVPTRIDDEMFHDDDHGVDGDEFAVGLGHRTHFGKEVSLDLVGFGVFSRMADRPKGAGLIGYPKEDDQQRIGSRVVYCWGELLLMAEYIVAEDGKLDRDAWYLQASHEFEFAPLIGGRFLTAVEPLVRYGHYNVDVTKAFTNPLTWDREQLTLALLCDIVDDVSMRIEYDINDEETGGREIANDEFRVQLRTRW